MDGRAFIDLGGDANLYKREGVTNYVSFPHLPWKKAREIELKIVGQ